MTSEKLAIDPSLAAVFGTSDALNQALACVRAAMLAINDCVELKFDHFALLKRAEDIIEYRRDIMDEVESTLRCPQNQPVGIKDGYRAANAWSAGVATT
ncbi:hypothetical protein [Paralcaligenes ureilyticus]|uniref:Uncharacterized protein n=1 Tax=Paralcaligenes ureilyticus TaxID=627131 RepID=A0A4R3M7M1_9BURK|nr:hypothetical protein [Paralcaligenes ureilyticus]TCT09474.1 hypothetical protein EDC26_10392 [Paralcaligenes ureilyticus]